MVKTGLLYKDFYRRIKEKMWKTVGARLYGERGSFLLDLLDESERESQRISHLLSAINDSQHYLLDIGCGTGDLTEKALQMYNLKTIGVDISRNFPLSKNRRSAFFVGDGCSLPFKSRSFLVAAALSVIEHIEETHRRRFYEEVSRVLIDGGILVMQLPNRYFPIEQHTFIPFLGYFPSRFHAAFFPGYINVPSKSNIVNDLTQNGYEIIRIVAYGTPFSGFLNNMVFSRVLPFGFLIVACKKRIGHSPCRSQSDYRM